METPPVPSTRTLSPAFSAPLTTRARHAVTPAVVSVAASVSEYPLGAWVNAAAGATTTSRAYPSTPSPGTVEKSATGGSPSNQFGKKQETEYQGNSVRVGMTWHGQGASVLMLPALSSISTGMEMWPLQERLGSRFTLAIDWVGFGDRPRPPLRWSPEIYRSFLAYLLTQVVPRPFATIAAGHAAAYCLDAAAARPGSTGRLCLIAPTWRGPLPTMMGRKHPMFAQISRMVDWPVVATSSTV